jgi:hypothetical protein
MNKLLTTITLLCFSVAANANADVYLCTEMEAVSMDRMRVFNSPMRDEDEIISIFLVDPERGLEVSYESIAYDAFYSLPTIKTI